MIDVRIGTETRWKVKGAHVGSYWTLSSLAASIPLDDDEDGLVSLSGPGPCRAQRYVPLSEFLRDWECIDTCDVCGSADVAHVRIVVTANEGEDLSDPRVPFDSRRSVRTRSTRCVEHKFVEEK